jgi:predicted nucleic acid-binding protein
VNWHVDASTLIALGSIGELELLATLDGSPVVASAVRAEVTTEPAATALEGFLDNHGIERELPDDGKRGGRDVLGDETPSGDAAVVGAVLAADGETGVVSDDRRVRTTARGLGATVTGTIGVIGRAVMVGTLDEHGAKRRLDRLDERGLHMTAELRRKPETLIKEAAEE